VHLRILDGDRSLEARVDPGHSLLVRGLLREPMLRIDDAGAFANAASPTSQSEKIVKSGSGWLRVASGPSFVWHEHRLTPAGARGRFVIPVQVNGRAGVIAGSFVRVARPAVWPWLAGAAVLAGAVIAGARRRAHLLPLTVALGACAGIAALAATIAFALRDRPAGGTGWLPIVAAVAIALTLAVPLVLLRGKRRAQVASMTGAVAAAAVITSLPVFWHGVVISALPADVVRLLCGLALVAGVSAAAVSLLPEFDE